MAYLTIVHMWSILPTQTHLPLNAPQPHIMLPLFKYFFLLTRESKGETERAHSGEEREKQVLQ